MVARPVRRDYLLIILHYSRRTAARIRPRRRKDGIQSPISSAHSILYSGFNVMYHPATSMERSSDIWVGNIQYMKAWGHLDTSRLQIIYISVCISWIERFQPWRNVTTIVPLITSISCFKSQCEIDVTFGECNRDAQFLREWHLSCNFLVSHAARNLLKLYEVPLWIPLRANVGKPCQLEKATR